MAIKNPSFILDWIKEPIIREISYVLGSYPKWEANKIPRQANLRAHIAAKWAASHNSVTSLPPVPCIAQKIK
jgi:hypothetical protein